MTSILELGCNSTTEETRGTSDKDTHYSFFSGKRDVSEERNVKDWNGQRNEGKREKNDTRRNTRFFLFHGRTMKSIMGHLRPPHGLEGAVEVSR